MSNENPNPNPTEAVRERQKAALWYSIGKEVDSFCQKNDVICSQQFIASLAETTWTQLENVTLDLESFAHHAGRSTINTDDVLLLARRNEMLEQEIRKFIETEKGQRGSHGGAGKKRKIGGGGAGGPGGPGGKRKR